MKPRINLEENKFVVVNLYGWYESLLALGISYQYLKQLKTPVDRLSYLHTVFITVPSFMKFLDVDAMNEADVEELDKMLGHDYEDGGDSGYAAFIGTNRRICEPGYRDSIYATITNKTLDTITILDMITQNEVTLPIVDRKIK